MCVVWPWSWKRRWTSTQSKISIVKILTSAAGSLVPLRRLPFISTQYTNTHQSSSLPHMNTQPATVTRRLEIGSSSSLPHTPPKHVPQGWTRPSPLSGSTAALFTRKLFLLFFLWIPPPESSFHFAHPSSFFLSETNRQDFAHPSSVCWSFGEGGSREICLPSILFLRSLFDFSFPQGILEFFFCELSIFFSHAAGRAVQWPVSAGGKLHSVALSLALLSPRRIFVLFVARSATARLPPPASPPLLACRGQATGAQARRHDLRGRQRAGWRHDERHLLRRICRRHGPRSGRTAIMLINFVYILCFGLNYMCGTKLVQRDVLLNQFWQKRLWHSVQDFLKVLRPYIVGFHGMMMMMSHLYVLMDMGELFFQMPESHSENQEVMAHAEEIATEHNRHKINHREVEKFQNDKFHEWFRVHMLQLERENSIRGVNNDKIRWLACGPVEAAKSSDSRSRSGSVGLWKVAKQVVEICEVSFDETMPCTTPAFELSGDDEEGTPIFEDEEGADDVGDAGATAPAALGPRRATRGG
ncbi:hypothetical protein U9M48_013611 [Paspalum notatum var. saurae]|uniref:Uncharacterized protein n=1 Tax=Paspalum notatum var. saurae TaxID=547442 RepID=A0AAQ3T2J8_PASNO